MKEERRDVGGVDVDLAAVDPVDVAAALVDDDAEAFEAKVAAGEFVPLAAVRDGDPLVSSC